jgi:hypothetical protein
MKTNAVRMNWLIPVLGIVLVGGGYAARSTYLGFQQTIDADAEFAETVDRVDEACSLLRIQTQFQGGGCPEAARRVDESLAATVATLDQERASPANEQTRSMLNAFFEYMAHHQAQNPPMAAILPAQRGVTEMGDQRLLAQALAAAAPGN